ncbi:hypothetical protein [Ornithinimicrobium tianjinense]|uniref:Excreted virulence factor EspC, type VII ESX diderm n=1 Tax=Ornithinimicrobium tianjinense TaxID=1195761 RepID=A0A917BKY7_9MICO|nr:hypothetical protein [Ornithinimicrobium tianjinense]GGF50017.1 hypothetical protein GCM10011366_17380 [Ornithinimicrobium tianjinense]
MGTGTMQVDVNVDVDTDALGAAAVRLTRVAETVEGIGRCVRQRCDAAAEGAGGAQLSGALTVLGRVLAATLARSADATRLVGAATGVAAADYRTVEEALVARWTGGGRP